jgi:SAM-dependent methyltransferase
VSVGVDLSTVAVAKARERLTTEGYQSRLAVGDLRALPSASAVFDVVLDVEAISCLDQIDVPTAWTEAARVLRPGGQFLTIAFTPRTDGADRGRRLGDRTVTDIDSGPLSGLGMISFLDEASVESLAMGAGLEIVETQLRSRTVGDERVLVEELVILTQKPES